MGWMMVMTGPVGFEAWADAGLCFYSSLAQPRGSLTSKERERGNEVSLLGNGRESVKKGQEETKEQENGRLESLAKE